LKHTQEILTQKVLLSEVFTLRCT